MEQKLPHFVIVIATIVLVDIYAITKQTNRSLAIGRPNSSRIAAGGVFHILTGSSLGFSAFEPASGWVLKRATANSANKNDIWQRSPREVVPYNDIPGQMCFGRLASVSNARQMVKPRGLITNKVSPKVVELV